MDRLVEQDFATGDMLEPEPIQSREIDRTTVMSIRHLLSGHDWEEAKGLCRNLLEIQRDPEVLNLLGFACFQSGEYAKAIQYCTEADNFGMKDWGNQFIIGLCWKIQDRMQAAIDAFRLAHAKESLSLDVAVELLSCYFIVGDLISWRLFYDGLHEDLKANPSVVKELEKVREAELVSNVEKSLRQGHIARGRLYAEELLKYYPKCEYFRMLDHIDFYDTWHDRKMKRADGTCKKPTLSVLVITYNHEKFIGRALDSILQQIADYKINIVIMEDCSTDSTASIVQDYERRFPDIIKAYCNQKNVGTLDPPQQKVTYRGLELLTGDYFAILEGDDYWSSDDKIQKQITFLENNALYVACSHNTVKVYEDASVSPHRFLYWEGMKADHTIADMITFSFFHSSSMVFRNFFRGKVPDHFRTKWSCDIFMSIFATQFGKIRYFDEDMSVYRAHSGGSYSNLTMVKGDVFNISSYIRYNSWLKFRYAREFALQIARRCAILRQRDGFADLNWMKRSEYAAIGLVAGLVHRVLSRWPTLSPSVWYHKEPCR